MRFSILLEQFSYRLPLEQSQQYFSKELLEHVSVVNGAVRVNVEKVLNISIAEGERLGDKLEVVAKSGVEAGNARSR